MRYKIKVTKIGEHKYEAILYKRGFLFFWRVIQTAFDHRAFPPVAYKWRKEYHIPENRISFILSPPKN